MKKKAQEEPEVMDKPQYVGWPGYTGAMTWGKTFVMKWPQSHPDSHCENHLYTPDEDGVCVCGYVPEDKIHCNTCNEPIRLSMEKQILEEMFEESPLSPDLVKIGVAAYLAYCDEFRDRLDGTPVVMAVLKWFQSKKLREQHDIVQKYRSIERRTVIIEIRSNLDLSGMFDGDLNDVPEEVIKELLNHPEVPKEVKDVLQEYLKTKAKK